MKWAKFVGLEFSTRHFLGLPHIALSEDVLILLECVDADLQVFGVCVSRSIFHLCPLMHQDHASRSMTFYFHFKASEKWITRDDDTGAEN